jgi:hypothetical protein
MSEKTPQQIIDEHMVKVSHRVMDVFENADEDALAEDVMPDIFEAIGLVENFKRKYPL